MPVTTTHPDYDENAPLWQTYRHVYGGPNVIKAAGETYLPRLSGQKDDVYENVYLRRALFYNMTPVLGAIFAAVMLHEPFELHHAVALAFVIGGVTIAERLGRRP